MIIYRLLSHSKLKQLRSTKKEIIYPKIGKHMKSNITQFLVKMSPNMYEVVKMPATANTTVLFATTKNQHDCLLTSRSILGSSLSCGSGQSDRLRILRGWRATKVDQKIPSGATAWGDRGAKKLMRCWRAG